MNCTDDKLFEDKTNPIEEKNSAISIKVSPFSAKASPLSTKTSIFENKASSLSPGVNRISSKPSSISEKDTSIEVGILPVVDTPVPVSPLCFDYVVKNFENGDFFHFQDGKEYLLTLDNAII